MASPALIAGVFFPLFLGAAVWVAAVAVRAILQGADAPSPASALPGPRRVREIRQAVRRLEYHLRQDAYRFERGRGSHLPPAWKAEAERRTN